MFFCDGALTGGVTAAFSGTGAGDRVRGTLTSGHDAAGLSIDDLAPDFVFLKSGTVLTVGGLAAGADYDVTLYYVDTNMEELSIKVRFLSTA